MLRCRRCRKCVVDSTCLSTQAEASEDSSEAGCTIWHGTLTRCQSGFLTSVHQAQWTVGKLYCQNCCARLGGFNFINHSECPCGRDAAVHLGKSRVDRDHKHSVLIVQPRRRRTSEKEQTAVLTDGCRSRERRTDFNSLHLNGAAQASTETPRPSPSVLCTASLTGERRSLEEDASIRSSCFCPTVKSCCGETKDTVQPHSEDLLPKVYNARKQGFQSAACAKWPLPSCRKRFRAFWGEQRQTARRWHFALGGFTLDTLDFGGVRGWLFDNGLVMVYIPVNWILATFFSFFFMYFFFF
ncbi:hypothetical protein KUCAC02_009241 [Chaenocephalus aceratus]|uniref:Uncharacterized protein n=1 Tax=Chaenocephalus aceratus TaxID=36190 RepID=A0ACB9WUN5_CHAAC|nr:hypothetical protein KUCAC02_009241 [Chaenocephalus aceratus]